jgi:hypothetical protein
MIQCFLMHCKNHIKIIFEKPNHLICLERKILMPNRCKSVENRWFGTQRTIGL